MSENDIYDFPGNENWRSKKDDSVRFDYLNNVCIVYDVPGYEDYISVDVETAETIKETLVAALNRFVGMPMNERTKEAIRGTVIGLIMRWEQCGMIRKKMSWEK